MPTQLLVNVLSVTLAPGGSVVLAHGLISENVGVIPTQVIADRTTPIACSNATTTNVAFINTGAEAATANFRCEYDHSIHATGATPIRYQGLDPSISGAIGSVDTLLFGTGSDGAVSLTAAGATPLPYATRVGTTWTLTREVYATNFTVEAGVTVDTRGFGVWCTGTFLNNGTHGVYGVSAAGIIPGTFPDTASFNFGSTTTGGSGVNITANGNSPIGYTSALNTNPLPGGNAGARTGGTSNSVYTTSAGLFPVITTPWYPIVRSNRGTAVVSSRGGGSGAADVSGGGTATSGGGASALPVLPIMARNFDNTLGTIQSIGGNGGNAVFTGAGIAGGGAAANGGVLYLLTNNLIALGTVQSVGGTGGLGANGGANGANGAPAATPVILITV
jgi:hypothetical protein